ncbi:hypothetical protein D7X33_15095 [Butyricicoccus sp. 1XD8-22]|nr:hypothetical protein D7X33_15095 [Butyricicoccus sp. 1XD8-22]
MESHSQSASGGFFAVKQPAFTWQLQLLYVISGAMSIRIFAFSQIFLCARAAGLCPCTPPRALPSGHPRLRGGRQGSALHPLGLPPQTPEMLAHLFFACGRDGGFGLLPALHAQWPSPPERRRAGLAWVFGWVPVCLLLPRTKSRWHDGTSGFS